MNQLIIPTNTSSGLQRYDTEKGLLALAAAEAAHKHFARAKNLDGLSKAIEAKLKEQSQFVLLRRLPVFMLLSVILSLPLLTFQLSR